MKRWMSTKRGVVAACLTLFCLADPALSASGPVMLNFINAEIDSVVRAMGQITGKNFLLDPRVKGTISISSVKPVSADLAYQILISSLRMQGFTAVEGKGVVKILPEADAKQHYSATYGKTVKSSGDQVVTQVYPLQHATAAQLVGVLRPLVAPNNAVSAYPGSNTLVITDYADNLKRISEIIESIDRPNEAEFNVIKVRHLSAIELAQQLSRLFSDPAGTPAQAGGNSLMIAADARSNSLLVRTDNQGKLDTLRAMVAQLDTPSAGKSNLQVVHLRNADATKLAETLRALAAGEARAAAVAPAGAAAATPAIGGGNNSGVTILADTASNSLVINAPDHLYNSLRAVIDKLDAQRAQLFIEALIVEVNSNKMAELGIQWQGPLAQDQGSYALAGSTSFNSGSGANLLALSAAAASGTATSLPSAGLNLALGQVLKVNGKSVTTLTALAHLFQSDGDTNILSTPNLLTLDNEEAKIVIGQNVPFVTGTYAQQGAVAGSAAGVNPFTTVERKDVGLTLKVKPQISEGGNIKMQILQEVSSVDDKTNSAGIITNKRSIETTVLVADGEAIVLGGLIQDDVQNGIDKVPGLGDIPLLGALFRSESRKRSKTNLMVFLRPVVVYTPEALNKLTQDRYGYISDVYGAYPAHKRWLMPDISPGKLPDLKLDSILTTQPKVDQKKEIPAPAPSFSIWPE